VALTATFFAVGSALFSYLLSRGRMIPIPLAWLGVIASVLLVVCLPLQLAGFLRGPIASFMWLPMLAVEVPLALWLLIKGVASRRGWHRPDAAAGGICHGLLEQNPIQHHHRQDRRQVDDRDQQVPSRAAAPRAIEGEAEEGEAEGEGAEELEHSELSEVPSNTSLQRARFARR
jgi:Domain of unknown function (DUF4386)